MIPGYDELLRRLLPRVTGGIRWGLERTERLLAAVGDPQRSYSILHVGGTNGKGSVSAFLASVLNAAGLRVGLYTSPHLCSFRERIQVAGRPLSVEELLAAAEALWPVLEAEGPTFFEAATALALLSFARSQVEVAVVEVGLGGRLDATNVVTPEVVVITNVALDHREYLGETLAEIAAEKAGILKPGVPAVTAEEGDAALSVLRRQAEEIEAPLTLFDRRRIRDVRTTWKGTSFGLDSEAWGRLDLRTSLLGAHQAGNAGLAIHALEELPPRLRPGLAAVRRGIAATRWPGRLQVERVGATRWILDAAHNPEAMRVLCAALRALGPARPLVAVVGILADKDRRPMLRQVADLADELILTLPPGAPAERRWDPERVAAENPGARSLPELRYALEGAAALAGEGTVLVTGSFYTVGAALAHLGRAPAGVDPPLPEPDRAPAGPP